MEEAIGNLIAVDAHEGSLVVTMDSLQFTVDFPTIESLELTRERLSAYVGKTIAVFHESEDVGQLRIRLLTSETII
jgi:hypothetical protein